MARTRDRRPGALAWAAFALPIVLNACSAGRPAHPPELPDLPRLSLERFLPAVRQELQAAYRSARANPLDAAACGRLGMLLHAHSQLEAAVVCYRRAALLDPGSFRWPYLLGVACKAQGQFDQAVSALSDAVRLNPDYLPAQMHRAESLFSSGKLTESARLYEDILTKHPDIAPAHHGLGRVRAALGRTTAAADSFRRACELFPRYGAAHYALATAYRALGQTWEARHHLELYEKDKLGQPPAVDPLLTQIRRLARDAQEYFREAIELEGAGDLLGAVEAQLKALELDPRLVQAHVNLISLYGRLGRLEDAEKHYRSAMALDQNSADCHYNYGVLLFGSQKYPEAAQALRRALEINPQHAEAHNNLGYLLELQGQLDEAMRHYRKALENQPGYRLARYHLGRLLVKRREFDEGIRQLLKTLAPEDESTPGYTYALATAFGRAGDREKALWYARRAREHAAALGQTGLLASIERDLRALEQAGDHR